MSNRDFIKGACRQCGGHLEFPADAVGQTITCPHCGNTTVLIAPNLPGNPRISRRTRLAIAVALCAAAVIPALMLLTHKTSPGSSSPASPLPPVQANPPAPVVSAPPKPQPLEVTNDFALMPFKLDKTPGSSLVYVTGSIQNLGASQRFGVKVEFGLFDTNDNFIGTATDYQQVIEPHGEWRFKAMVIESKAATARLNSITEAQ